MYPSVFLETRLLRTVILQFVLNQIGCDALLQADM